MILSLFSSSVLSVFSFSSSCFLAFCSLLPFFFLFVLQALSLFGDAAVCNFAADDQVEVEGVGADGNTVKVRGARRAVGDGLYFGRYLAA